MISEEHNQSTIIGLISVHNSFSAFTLPSTQNEMFTKAVHFFCKIDYHDDWLVVINLPQKYKHENGKLKW